MFLVFLVLSHYCFCSVLIFGRNFPGRNVQWGEIAEDESSWGENRGANWGGANCGGANWNDTTDAASSPAISPHCTLRPEKFRPKNKDAKK